jgi:hypothetical protein
VLAVTPQKIVFSSFEGAWSLHRRIEDQRAGQSAQLTGAVRLARDTTGLRYHEQGQLHIPGQQVMASTRVYLWRPGSTQSGSPQSGSDVVVLFEDGRYFHTFSLTDPTPQASHFCEPDQYEVSYDFTLWPKWRSTWRVHGPRKTYTMISDYAPA